MVSMCCLQMALSSEVPAAVQWYMDKEVDAGQDFHGVFVLTPGSSKLLTLGLTCSAGCDEEIAAA